MASTSDDRKEYTVDINGIPHTMLLDDAHAETYGDKATAGAKPKASGAESKVHTPANKGG